MGVEKIISINIINLTHWLFIDLKVINWRNKKRVFWKGRWSIFKSAGILILQNMNSRFYNVIKDFYNIIDNWKINL